MNKISYTSNDIYQILEQEITTLELSPGQYISESEISKRFGVSRTPVRDVFKKLEYKNLIKVIPQKGTIITTINLSNIAEYMFGRRAIELSVISEVFKIITPYMLVKLEILLASQLNVIEDTSLSMMDRAHKFLQIDNTFHKELYSFANKEMLWELFSTEIPDYQRFRAVVAEYSDYESLKKLYEQHQQILKCIENRDLESIAKVFDSHVYNGMDFLTDILSQKENYFSV